MSAAPEKQSASPFRHYILAAITLSIIITAYYLPSARNDRSLGEGEAITYYMPMRQLVAEAWKEHRWPLWNPYVYGGMPLLADCQAGAFYPSNILFLCLKPMLALNAILLTGQIIAAWGMIFLQRAYRVSAFAATAGALAFVFSGFMIAHMGHVTIVNAAAWLPWLCLVTHGWCTQRKRRWLIAGTILWSIQFFAGHPQIFLYSVILVAMQTVTLLFSRGLQNRETIRTLAGLALMATLTIAICAIQMLPTLAFTPESVRNFEPSYQLFENYHFAVKHSPLLWLPYLYGTQSITPLNAVWHSDWNFVEQAGYAGLLPWMLLPAAFYLPTARQRHGRTWAVIAGLHLLLAWNTATPIGRLLFHVPIYNSFEAASRHLVGLILALSMCTGIALDALAETDRLKRIQWTSRGAMGIAMLVLVLAIAVAWAHRATDYPWTQNPFAFITPIIIAALTTAALIHFARNNTRIARTILLTVLFIDVAGAGYFCAWRFRAEDEYEPVPPPADISRLLIASEPNTPRPRFFIFGPRGGKYWLSGQGSISFHLASLNGNSPLEMQRIHDMVSGLNQDGVVRDERVLNENPAINLWSCRYVMLYIDPGQSVPAPLQDPTHYRRVADDQDLRVYENLRALPRARWQDEQQTLPQGLASSRPSPTTSNRVAWASSSLPVANQQGRSIQWNTYEPNHIALDVQTDRPSTLILAETYLDGWQAAVDNQPTPIIRTNEMLRAVNIPPGTHTVTMNYEPASLRHGLYLSITGLIGLLALALWPRTRAFTIQT